MKFDDQSLLANHQFDAVASNRAAANDFNYLRKSKSYYDYNKRQNLNNLKSHYKNLGIFFFFFLFEIFIVKGNKITKNY